MRRLAPLLVLLLAACKAGPDYAPPGAGAAPQFERNAFLRAGAASAEPATASWWEALGDPALSNLIDQAMAKSPSLEAARARIREARAGLAAARAGMRPSAGASALYVYADLPSGALGSGGGTDFTSLGFDAQWEADLWGGKRRGVEKAAAEGELAEAMLADAQVSLSAEVARTYVTLRAREASLEQIGKRRGLEEQLAGLARQRFRQGTASRIPVEAAAVQLARSQGERALLEGEIVALRDGLAVLTGEAPGALDSLSPAPPPLPPPSVAIGDPATLLARRPDIRAADRRYAAATARIGIEQARRMPSISLMGLIGIGGASPADIFDPSQLSALALPRLSWSFLDGGRGKAAVAGAEAGRDAAMQDYRATVLAALGDAESSLARFGAAREALARSGEQARHLEEIAGLQILRARGGTAPLSQAIEARRAATDARLAEINDRASLTLAYVALAKSLGLGWRARQE